MSESSPAQAQLVLLAPHRADQHDTGDAVLRQMAAQVRTHTNDPEGEIAVDTVYDGKGRKSQATNPYRISGGT